MTEQAPPPSGSVAEEAARLIEALASMARVGTVPGTDPSPYAGGAGPEPGAAGGPGSTGRPRPEPPSAGPPESSGAPDQQGVCGACGSQRAGTAAACRLCPLCQGIALLRSVRPETVDRLADFASAVAASLHEMATQARASTRASAPTARNGAAPGHANVQDIAVNDEGQG